MDLEKKDNKNNNQSATTAAPTTNAATKAGGPLKQFVRQVSTTIRSKVTKSASRRRRIRRRLSLKSTTQMEAEILPRSVRRRRRRFSNFNCSSVEAGSKRVARCGSTAFDSSPLLGSATAFGSCNFRISKHPSTVKRRVSVLMQSCINNGMLALCRTLNNFPRERLVVRREMRRNVGGYHPGAYFFAKLLVETPIDMLFPVAFGMIVSPMVGLNPAGRQKFVSALALHAASSAALGLAVSRLRQPRKPR